MDSAGTMESLLPDVASEMIGAALEMADPAASDVFVYGSIEEDVLTFASFYLVDGEVVDPLSSPGASVPPELLDALEEAGLGQLRRLERVAREAGAAVPTEIRVHHVVRTRATDIKVKYELQWADTEDRVPDDVLLEWRDEVRAGRGATPGPASTVNAARRTHMTDVP